MDNKWIFEEMESIEKYGREPIMVHVCPLCGSSDVVRNGTYERNVVIAGAQAYREHKVKLQRFLCKHCHKTRTGYPHFVVPYRIYSTASTLLVLLSRAGIFRTSRRTGIPISKVREIRKRFRVDANKIRTLLSQMKKPGLLDVLEKQEEQFGEKVFHGHQREGAIPKKATLIYDSW